MAQASTPERLVNVLEQYRDKLHQAGDSVHDEEMDYIKDILASPLFKQYLKGTLLSQEDSTILNEATNNLITGFENSNDSSPSEKRKSHLQRKQSLKTLRNVVTPKNSSSNLVQRVESSKSRQPRGSPLHNGASRSEVGNPLEHVAYSRLQSGDSSYKSSTLTHEGTLSNRVKSLSNSTSTLIDRPSNGAMRKKSSDLNLLSSGSFNSLSGSQPNISSLKLSSQFLNGLPGAQNGFGNGHPSQKLVLASPEARPPPPSYMDHIHNQTKIQQASQPEPQHKLYRKASSVDKLFEPSPSPEHVTQATPLAPPTHPMTNGSVTKDLSTVEKRKTTFTVRMDKGPEGLGFMVKSVPHESRGEIGLCIQDLQPGGLAERDGHLRRNDQITHINGHSLSTLPHSDAVVLLQSFRGPVDLVIVREHPSQATPPSSHRRLSPPASPASASSARSPHSRKAPDSPSPRQPSQAQPNELPQSSNQQKIVTIELPNDGRRGFGFSVVSERDSHTVVHSVVAGGIAEQDGRLQRGDQLLQINEESVLHMDYNDIIVKLRTVSQAGNSIRLVIARVVSMETDDGDVPEINDSSDDDLEEFEVELNRGNNKGLGMTIAGLVKTDTEEEVKGIYITSLNPTGAAAQNKKIKVGDRILKVDGHSLRGLENMEAASVLRNSGNPVRVVLSRKKIKRNDKPSVPSLPVITDEAGLVETTAEQAVDKWTRILGPDFIVKVDEVSKMDNGGLGIRMESTAEFDEEGELHSNSVHHVIQYIHPQGPVGHHGILREGDEILEINGNVLLGLQHNEAIEVVKHTASHVQVVICREKGVEGDTATTTTESAESEAQLTGPDETSQPDSLLAIPFDTGDSFSRRLERRSWRERHEQQKKLIKQRFEQKREEFLRHRQEQDDELDQQEAELREQQRQAEESERRESEKDRNSDPLLPFTYPSYHEGLDEPLRSPDSIMDSDSSLLSPVPGSTLWDDEVSEVLLVKGNEGLGFSILDFADPLQEGAKVILVHSLVEGGAAEQEDQLRVGDRLLTVNRVSVINHPLDFAVQQLVSVPLGGTVLIGVNHPLPGEGYSALCSPYSMEGDDRDMRESTESVGEASPAEDEEEKPLSGEEEPEGGPATESEGHDNPEEDSEDKKKKPDTDDDEPPPPYSKDDPQEEKSGDPQASPEASNSTQPKLQSGSDITLPDQTTPHVEIETVHTKLETHSNDDIDSPHTNTPSPLSPALLSSISSPERGRSLSDLTRIKPGEEASFKPTASAVTRHENTEFESCSSDTTIVNSQSQPSQSELGPESTSSTVTSGSLNSTPVYVSSPSSDRGHKPSLSSERRGRSKDKAVRRTKGKRFPAKSYKSQQSKDSSPGTPTQENLTVAPSQGTLGSSQESSCFEGLSPELSDFGEHSTEVDTDPREVRIRKSGSNFGLHLAFDDKSNCITVKSVSSGSAVGKDGRIRVGDRINSINGKSLTGVNLKRAKDILKKACSSRSSELQIVYAPVPQVQTVQVIPAAGAPFINSPGNRSSITEAVIASQPGQQFYPQSGNLPVHVITQYPPGIIQPQYNMAAYQGVPQSVPGAYYPRFDDQISKPPPPYMFPHQSGPSPTTAMLSQNMTPYQSPQSQPWNQLSQNGSNVHMMQPSPNLPGNQWQGSHMTSGLNHMTPGPVLRDPPQYGELHMMALQQNQQQQQQSGPAISVAGSLSQQYVRPPQTAHFEHPPHLSQSSRPVVSPRPMNKSQSETKFRPGATQRPNLERRHKSQNGANHTPKKQGQYKNSESRGKQRGVADEVFDNTELTTGATRRATGEEPTEHAQGTRKKEKLEPVRSAKYSRTLTLQESPDHSHHNSWAIEDEEDPAIRAEFPEADGHLFEVTLQKGKAGLGLSIVANDSSQSIRGIVIMGIQQRGVAEQCGLIKWGDMILKVNDSLVIGMSQTEVQELLAKAPPTVRFVLLRQHMVKHTQAGSDISLDGLAQVKAVTLFTDDKKSQFGFNIEKGELVGGAPSVRISHLTTKGPAELSNSLQVGDQILSVDGQKILGYAYEKARLLLQQAKQRGQVTIVVASHSPTNYKEGGLEHNQPSRPAEDVVLRPKRKRSSLKPSRRRPVSVDFDGKMGPSNGSQGSQKSSPLETSRTSFHSNRSSQPLTEREMEQGFQYFEQKDKDITPWEECEIIIFMGPHDLGLVLGGNETGIHIQRITPDSPADKDGRLKPSDRIKMINNTAMEGLTRDEALQVLKNSPAFVHLTVLRESNKSVSNLNLNEDPSFPEPEHSSDVEIIELVKPERSGFGLLICENEEDHNVYVQDVVKGKAAYLDGRVHPGDRLLAINGQDVSNARQHYVVQLLQNCAKRVTLEVLHPPHKLHTSHDHYGRPGDLDLSPGDPSSFQFAPPPPDYSYSVPGRPGHDRLLSPYTRVAESSQQTDYVEYMGHQFAAGYRDSPANEDPDIDTPLSSQEENYHVQVIHLHRGPTGLGFSIVGGKGSKHGDLPIFIKSVFEEGAAGKDGRLRMGDQILSVNGYSFENVTHAEAVETLKLIKGDIELTVLKTD